MHAYKEEKAEVTSESHPALKVEVFPDHLRTNIMEFRVRFGKERISAETECENWRVLFGRHSEQKAEVTLPLVKVTAFFNYEEFSSFDTLAGIFVKIHADFTLGAKKKRMLGAIDESRIYPTLLTDRHGREEITLDDKLREELRDKLQALRGELAWNLKENTEITPALYIHMAANKNREEKFKSKVEELTERAIQISKESGEIKRDALLPLVIGVIEMEDSWLVVAGVLYKLFELSEAARNLSDEKNDASTKASLAEMAKRLTEVRKIISDLWHEYVKEINGKKEGDEGL